MENLHCSGGTEEQQERRIILVRSAARVRQDRSEKNLSNSSQLPAMLCYIDIPNSLITT